MELNLLGYVPPVSSIKVISVAQGNIVRVNLTNDSSL